MVSVKDGSQPQTSDPPLVTAEMFKAADAARTAYLRDEDANDQMSALYVSIEAAMRVYISGKQ